MFHLYERRRKAYGFHTILLTLSLCIGLIVAEYPSTFDATSTGGSSSSAGTSSWYVGERGYYLSGISLYANPLNPSSISGFKLTYSSDCDTSKTPIVQMIGSQAAGYTEYKQTIATKVTSVDLCFNSGGFIEDIQLSFTPASDSPIKLGNSALCSNLANIKSLPVKGNLVGISYTPSSDQIPKDAFSIWDDFCTFKAVDTNVLLGLQSAAFKMFGNTEVGCYSYVLTTSTGSAVPQPVEWLSKVGLSMTFKPRQTGSIGTYKIKVSPPVKSSCAASGENSIQVNIQNGPCTDTTFIPTQIADIIIKVNGAPTTQDLNQFFEDSIAKQNVDSSQCGARIYTISPVSTFLSNVGSDLKLLSTSIADVGTHSFTATASLKEYSGVASITSKFKVIVECEAVVTLSFTKAPSAKIKVQIGINSLPFKIPFDVSRTPSCSYNDLKFDLSGASALSAKITDLTGTGGSFELTSATLLNVGKYPLILTATKGTVTIFTNFELEIANPCATAIFETNPSLSSVNVALPTSTTQVFQLRTDVERIHNIVCPINAVLSPVADYLQLSSDQKTITVEPTKIAPSDAGSHSFTLSGSLKDFSAVAAVINPFTVAVTCVFQTIAFTTAPSPTVKFQIGIDTQPFKIPFAIFRTPACINPTSMFTISGLAPAAGFTVTTTDLTATDGNIQVQNVILLHVGKYQLTLTAKEGALTILSNFELEIVDPCAKAIIEIYPVLSTVKLVYPSTVPQVFQLRTDIERIRSSIVCPIVVVVQPSVAYIKLSSDQKTITFDPTKLIQSDVGTHSFSMSNTLKDFPSVAAVANPFTVNIDCIVQSITFTQKPPASAKVKIGIDAMPFNIPFNVIRSPACLNAVPTFTFSGLDPTKSFSVTTTDLTASGANIEISNFTKMDHGKYQLTLIAKEGLAMQSVAFELDMDDPCVAAKLMTNPSLVNTNVKIDSNGTLRQIQLLTDVESLLGKMCQLTPVLSPTKTYISQSSNKRWIYIDPTKMIPSDAGVNTFSIGAYLSDSTQTGQLLMNFSVTITCEVLTLGFKTTPAAIVQVKIGMDSPFKIPFEVSRTPACLNAVPSFSISEFSATAGFLVTTTDLTATGGNVQIITSTKTTIGKYNLFLKATEGTISISTPFELKIIDPCSAAIFETNPSLSSVNFALPTSTTQVFQLRTDVQRLNSSIVCPIIAVFQPTAAYIQLSSDSKTITLDPAKMVPSDVGSHSFTLSGSLKDFSAVAAVTNPFTVTITCAVSTLEFSNTTPLASSTIKFKIGVDSLPFKMPFDVLRTPACPNGTVTFTIAGQANLSISTTDLTAKGGNIQLLSALKADINQYQLVLTAKEGEITISRTFTLDVVDPCSTAVFETNPSLSSGIYFALPSAGTQVIKLLTDVEKINQSILCPIRASLNSSPPYITLSEDFKTITIDPAKMSEGTQAFVLKIDSPTFQTSSTINFNVVAISGTCAGTILSMQTINSMTFIFGSLSPTVQKFFQIEDSLSKSLKNPLFCGSRKYELISESSIITLVQPTDPWTQQFELRAFTSDPLMQGSFNAKLKVSIPTQPSVTSLEISFTVSTVCNVASLRPIKTALTLSKYSYQMGDKAKVLQMPAYELKPLCNRTISYRLENNTFGSLTTDLPSFISYDSKTNFVTLFGKNKAETNKSYSFVLVATEEKDKIINMDYIFVVEVPRNLPPYFETALTQKTVTAGTASQWTMPKIIDPEGNTISLINVKLGTLSKWCQFDASSLEFIFDGNKLAIAGIYLVQIEISDAFGSTLNIVQTVTINEDPSVVKAISQTVPVLPPSNSTTTEGIISNQTLVNSTQGNLTSNLTLSNQTDNATSLLNSTEKCNQTENGNLTCDLNQTSAVPNQTNLISTEQVVNTESVPSYLLSSNGKTGQSVSSQTPPQKTKEKKNQEVKELSPPQPLEVKLSALEWGCGAKMEFNTPIQVSDKSKAEGAFKIGISDAPTEFGSKRMLDDQVKPAGNDFKLEVQIAPDGMSITYKAVLNNPYDISVGSSVSSLSIVPTGDSSFLSGKDGPVILPELPSLIKQLPAQVVDDDIKLLQDTTNATTRTTISSFVISAVTAVLIAGSLVLIWGMVGVLQNISIMAFVNVNYPGNAQSFIFSLNNIANWNLLPEIIIQPWISLLSKSELNDEEKMKRKFNQRFYQMKIVKSHPVVNLQQGGLFIIILIVQLVFVLLIPYIFRCKSRHVERLRMKAEGWKKHIFWNACIRLFIEIFQDICISILVRMTTFELATKSQKAFTAIALMMLVATFGVLVLLTVLLYRNRADYKNKTFLQKYGELVKDLNTNTFAASFYYVFFLLQRILQCCIVVFLQHHAVVQIQLLIQIAVFQLIYIAYARPYLNDRINNLELINAAFTLLAGYTLIVFSDYTDSGKVRYDGAKYLIFILVLICIINIVFQFWESSKVVIPRLRKKYQQLKIQAYKHYMAKLKRAADLKQLREDEEQARIDELRKEMDADNPNQELFDDTPIQSRSRNDQFKQAQEDPHRPKTLLEKYFSDMPPINEVHETEENKESQQDEEKDITAQNTPQITQLILNFGMQAALPSPLESQFVDEKVESMESDPIEKDKNLQSQNRTNFLRQVVNSINAEQKINQDFKIHEQTPLPRLLEERRSTVTHFQTKSEQAWEDSKKEEQIITEGTISSVRQFLEARRSKTMKPTSQD